MKILHLAAGNRWTGAAAPAFAEVAALREAGVDAHFAYVGGYKLETKLQHVSFAHPVIAKAQNPLSFFRTVSALRSLMEHHRFDFLHAHLTYDHALAWYLARQYHVHVARTFHARRVIRRDPFTRLLIRASDVICVTNDALRDAEAIRDREPLFTPPPVDLDEFQPDGPDVRERYAIPAGVPLVMVIGKLSADRGFELAIRTFADLSKRVADVRFMIVGHGEHRPVLEKLADETGVSQRLTWAGYHEDHLADHYRASDVLLFTSSGSDEGHRAVLEAMACGVLPAVIPLEGMAALVEPQSIASAATPAALADVVVASLSTDLIGARSRMVERCVRFSYLAAAKRLEEAYSQFL